MASTIIETRRIKCICDMETFDSEKFIVEYFKSIPYGEIAFFGNFFRCFRVEMLIKSLLFKKSWIDSSSKSDLPPDFHNNKHKIIMDIMRIDDCVNIKDGKHVPNSFQRENDFMKKLAGKDYKKRLNGSLYFVSDTRDNSVFNFDGYFNNFKRVLIDHSNKVGSYRNNYPKCKTCVLFICDEANVYVQVTDKEDLKRKEPIGKWRPHIRFNDKEFLDVIKIVHADYVVWMGRWTHLFTSNGRKIKMPQAAIYDIKHLKDRGSHYNHCLMFKVVDEERIK